MFHLLTQPLLADIGEIIGGIVGLVALLFWVIKQISEAGKAMGGQPAQPAGEMPQAQAAPQGAPRPAGQQADPLRNQVEEFLRRAGRGQQPNQGGQQPRRLPQQSQEIEVLLDDDALAERRPARVPPRPMEGRPAVSRQAPTPPSDQRPARRSVIPKKRVTLAERATERAAVRAETLSKQVSQLGKRVIDEDRQFDVQHKAKFDHTVGTLTGQTGSPTELEPVASTSPAGQIAAMLASPEGVRQAVVLNEILQRPSDRW